MRLILDFILSSVDAERRRHFTFPYGMLIRIFEQAHVPVEGHRSDEDKPTATVDTYTDLGMKPKDP